MDAGFAVESIENHCSWRDMHHRAYRPCVKPTPALADGGKPNKWPRACVRAPAAEGRKHEPTIHGSNPKASWRQECLTYPSGGRGKQWGPKALAQKEPALRGRGWARQAGIGT